MDSLWSEKQVIRCKISVQIVGQPKLHFDVNKHAHSIKCRFAHQTSSPALIVGNGPSARDGVTALSPLFANLDQLTILRSNWFYLEHKPLFGRRVDGYFWTIAEPALEHSLISDARLQSYDVAAWFSPMQSRLSKAKGRANSQFDPWALLAQNPEVAKFMENRPLPTTGLQMVAFALIAGFREIGIIGMDFYQPDIDRYAYSVPRRIASKLPDKDTEPGYESAHNRRRDFAFLDLLLRQYPDAKFTTHSHCSELHTRLKEKRGNLIALSASSAKTGLARLKMSRPCPSFKLTKSLVVRGGSDKQRRHLQSLEGKAHLAIELHGMRAAKLAGSQLVVGESNLSETDVRALEDRLLTPKSSQTGRDKVGKNAYITFATLSYLPGVLALAHSLARVTSLPLVVLTTDKSLKSRLEVLPNVQVRVVEPIENPNYTVKRARFRHVYTKLRIFGLNDYDRLVYLDSDMVVRASLDHLFSIEGFAAAPDWGEELALYRFNSGLMVFSPSEKLLKDMLEKLEILPSDDGGDQGFLNAYFSKWSSISVRDNTLVRMLYCHPSLISLDEVRALHFVGTKPWQPAYRSKKEIALLELWDNALPSKLRVQYSSIRTRATLQNASVWFRSWWEEFVKPRSQGVAVGLRKTFVDFVENPFPTVLILPRKAYRAVLLIVHGP